MLLARLGCAEFRDASSGAAGGFENGFDRLDGGGGEASLVVERRVVGGERERPDRPTRTRGRDDARDLFERQPEGRRVLVRPAVGVVERVEVDMDVEAVNVRRQRLDVRDGRVLDCTLS